MKNAKSISLQAAFIGFLLNNPARKIAMCVYHFQALIDSKRESIDLRLHSISTTARSNFSENFFDCKFLSLYIPDVYVEIEYCPATFVRIHNTQSKAKNDKELICGNRPGKSG